MTDYDGEVWKPIPNYEGLYEVSNLGRVKSLTEYNRWKAGRILRPQLRSWGYYAVGLYKNKKVRGYFIHRLEMLAFVGYRPKGIEVNHKDGNKLNNRLENLEYVTPKENSIHAAKAGLLHPKHGVEHNRARLNDNLVREIRQLHATGQTSFGKLAKEYGVSRSTIQWVVQRKCWKHVE